MRTDVRQCLTPQATKDPFYLRVGERILRDIRDRTKTSCGFATMKDVETGEVSPIRSPFRQA